MKQALKKWRGATMIISNSRKFIFVHIPKCGGTTVSTTLESHLLPQDVSLNLKPDDWQQLIDAYRRTYNLHKHSTALEIANAMGKENFRSYRVFTFVRNPFARAYSIFNFTKRSDARLRPNSVRYLEIKDMNFEEFLQSKYMQEHRMIQSKHQVRWLKDAPVKMEVFKIEDSMALPTLMHQFYGEWIEPSKVPRLNRSAGADAWKRMSNEAEDIVRELYAEDFAALEYPDRVPRHQHAHDISASVS